MMKTIIKLAAIFCILFQPDTFAQDNSQNYISIHTKTDSLGLNELVEIQYFDGLGRPVQKTQKGITPTGKDLVTKIEYDYCGRLTKNWLPIPLEATAGFVNIANYSNISKQYYVDDRPYTENKYYEGSWYDKLIGEQMAGVDLGGHYKAISIYPNSQNSIAKFIVKNGMLERAGYYDEKTLIYTTVTDEDGKAVEEYKDKLGQVVLKRSKNGGESENVDTYFVYNDMGQLSFVIPPKAADILKNNTINNSISNDNDNLKKFGYLYKYDERGNCIYKRLPGCTPIYMIYDRADRLVLSQDGNQRIKPTREWTATKYDVFGRVIYTGTMSRTETDSTTNYKSIRDIFVSELVVDNYTANNFSNCTPLTENYYDNYSFLTPQSILNFVSEPGYDAKHTSAMGMLTGSRVYVLGNPNQFTTTATYYDYRGLVVQTRSNNHMGGLDLLYNQYNFTGQVLQSLKKHTANGQAAIDEFYTNTYDHAGRLLKTKYKINTKPEIVLVDNSAPDAYDELGRLRKKKRHSTDNGTTFQDSEEYDYNIRNWATRIKSGTFEEKLYYNTELPTGVTACYNGNIAYQTWKNGSPIVYAYRYAYDNLNRLKYAAAYNGYNSPTSSIGYSEDFGYDKHGNINYLQRKMGNTLIDYFSSPGYNGNQITSIFDYCNTQNQYTTKEYQDKNHVYGAANEMAYDVNGNLTKDLDRDIVTIKYNLLNLPEIIQFKNGNQIRNLYDASGQKLQTRNYTVYDYTLQPIVAENTIRDVFLNEEVYVNGTDYIGNVEYHYDAEYFGGEFSWDQIYFSMLYNPEGYCQNLTYSIFNYYRRDHLGNNREVWRAPWSSGSTNYAATTIQRTHYYPSGLPWNSTTGLGASVQNKKFNGCEFIEMHGLDVTDLGNRGVQNATNRFTSMDRFCEKFPWQSPYVHAGNNPVNYVDVMGDSIILTGDNVQQTIMAIYNGMADDSNISMKFNNGVLDPSSIENEAQNTTDFFLQDLYEIAVNPTMVELSTSNKNTYMKEGIKVEEEFDKPYDYDTSSDPQAEKYSKNIGDPIGKTFIGNIGQTLVSKERSLSGKYSTSNNLQIIINAKGTINQQTVGLAHEFGHVILYMRNQYHGHSKKESNVFIYDQRATPMSRRLGYDF